MELKTKQQIQGCVLREIMKSLEVPQHEIISAKQWAYMIRT